MRISDWSSDVCSSDLAFNSLAVMGLAPKDYAEPSYDQRVQEMAAASHYRSDYTAVLRTAYAALARAYGLAAVPSEAEAETRTAEMRSEEHTSELQSIMRNSYAAFCMTKKHNHIHTSLPVPQ